MQSTKLCVLFVYCTRVPVIVYRNLFNVMKSQEFRFHLRFFEVSTNMSFCDVNEMNDVNVMERYTQAECRYHPGVCHCLY